MVKAAGPNTMRNKAGKIKSMVMITSGTNINHPELKVGYVKRIMMRTAKRRTLANKANPIAIAKRIGPKWTPAQSEALLFREKSLLS